MKRLIQAPIFRLSILLVLGILSADFVTFIEANSLAYCCLGMIVLSGLFLLLDKKVHSLRFELFSASIIYTTVFLLGVLLWKYNGAQEQELEMLNCQELVLAGRLIAPVKDTDYGRKTEMEVWAYQEGAEIFPISGKIQLQLPLEMTDTLEQDDSLYVKVYLTNIRSSHQSYLDYLHKRGLYLKGYVKRIHRLNKHTDLGFYARQAQALLVKKMENLIPDIKIRGIAKAMFLGKKDDLDAQIKSNFSAAGLSHVLAISGLHVGIIFVLLNFLLSPLCMLPGGDRIKNLVIILLLIAYTLITGASPAVIRSVLMFASILTFRVFHSRYDILNVLAVSALAQLLFEPTLIFQIGFQLSYSAVIGIVSLFPIFEKFVETPWPLLNKLYAWVGVSLAATLFTAPLIWIYFGQFPTYFVLSNVLASLPITIAVFLGFLTMVFIWLPGLNALLAWFLGWALYVLIEIGGWIASLSGAVITRWSFAEEGVLYLIIELSLTAIIILLPKALKHFKVMPLGQLVLAGNE